jgi:hypothetical protein
VAYINKRTGWGRQNMVDYYSANGLVLVILTTFFVMLLTYLNKEIGGMRDKTDEMLKNYRTKMKSGHLSEDEIRDLFETHRRNIKIQCLETLTAYSPTICVLGIVLSLLSILLSFGFEKANGFPMELDKSFDSILSLTYFPLTISTIVFLCSCAAGAYSMAIFLFASTQLGKLDRRIKVREN